MTEGWAGPGFDALPLPAIILDGALKIAAVNDAAEQWLHLSRRAALGRALDAAPIRARLRITPDPADLIARMRREGRGLLTRPGAVFDLADRSGGHRSRRADLHIGPAPDPAGDEAGAIILISPSEPMGGAGPGHAARAAARQAIGMAEMLAHEIKNPLAGIQGAAQLLAMGRGGEDCELLDLIVAESRRIVALLEQVERFGDTTAPDCEPVNLHDVLERARKTAALGAAKGMRIVTDYDPSLPPALADADQIMQVLLNLLTNAAEAITRGAPEGGAGTIRLRSFYDGALRLAEGDAPSRHLPLHIEVEDDGPGIPAEIAGQIFEPFVSGRENGTGLGLALISKIMTDHGGWVQVSSRPGRTVFRISLPKA
ncbi:MAG: ATP-binding protein [Paracoccus sp. (in: a-proteobacteria)]|nr:ATP-binding protein [Paracoccus sp. (in: a-proteobacteria)]